MSIPMLLALRARLETRQSQGGSLSGCGAQLKACCKNQAGPQVHAAIVANALANRAMTKQPFHEMVDPQARGKVQLRWCTNAIPR
mmetsp:Transcript_76171/g.150631  ORF Transcript_76171/g.150631 Transcript_76171/m.150631 type:complete len:85 (-) Transcript_76171:48-302(-)